MNRPLVYYAFIVFLGCVSSYIFYNNVYLGAVFTASFLVLIYKASEREYLCICILFFALGMLSFVQYFNFKLKSPASLSIHVDSSIRGNCIGAVQGRKLVLWGNTAGITEDSNILATGFYKPSPDYENGTVGNFYINKYKVTGRDLSHAAAEAVYNKFSKNLGKSKAGKIMAVCFSVDDFMSDEEKIAFNEKGIGGLLKASGYHMAVLYSCLVKVLGVYPSVLILFIYLLFAGGGITAARAFIILLISKLSKSVLKNYDSLSALSLAVIIILLWKPYSFLNVGFNISVLAVLGIDLYIDILNRKFIFMPKFLRKKLSLFLSAQVFTVPYIAICMGSFSLNFFFAGLILIPLYTVLIAAGNISIIFISFDKVFKLLCSGIDIIIIGINGIEELLSKITPPEFYFSSYEGYIFAFIVLSFILALYKIKNAKALMIILTLLFIIGRYKYFLQIDFINKRFDQNIVIQYKCEKILILNSKDKNGAAAFYNKLNPTKELVVGNNGCKINLGNKYNIKIDSTYGEDEKKFKVYVLTNNRRKLILSSNSSSKFTIIRGNIFKIY